MKLNRNSIVNGLNSVIITAILGYLDEKELDVCAYSEVAEHMSDHHPSDLSDYGFIIAVRGKKN